MLREVNLIVGTTNNYAAMDMSIKKAAKGLIVPGKPVTDAVLNTIEMAFRAYDPCLGCATHTLPGQMPMLVRVFDAEREIIQEIRRD
jgi:F420-non-reducing hydrogenase large subunit